MKITFNVPQSWGLERLSSSTGQPKSQELGNGKGLKSRPWWARFRRVRSTSPSSYLVAERLWLTPAEHGETLEAALRAPAEPGLYLGWIHASADEGDCGVHTFRLQCRS